MENPRRAILYSVYFSWIQLLLVTCWTIYVAFLPELSAHAGLPAGAMPWILLVSQAVFAVSDLALGFAADRMREREGKFGPWIALMTAISCFSFLFLPFLGNMNSVFLLVLILTWVLSSAVLRAPAFVLVMEGASPAAIPWLSSISLFGLGVASALAPTLGRSFRESDARIAFSVAAALLFFSVVGLIRTKSKASGERVPEKTAGRFPVFLGAALLIGLGTQIQTFMNGPMQIAKNAAESSDWLLPAFWAGFCVLVFPVLKFVARFGAGMSLAAAALIGSCGIAGAQYSASAAQIAVAHLVAGAGWGGFFALAIAWSIEQGRGGREAFALGAFFSMLSASAFLRILLLVLNFHRVPDWVRPLQSAPLFLWVLAGLILLVALPHSSRRSIKTDSMCL